MATPTNNTPEVFTLTFWQTTAARMVHYAAVLALGAWGLGATPVANIPGWGVLIAGGLGAGYALLEALAGAYVPPARILPIAALYPRPRQTLAVTVNERPA